LYNIKGGYGLDPRWGVGIRKGKLRVEIQKIISAEELAKMPVEELHELIKKTLDAKDYESGEKYTSKRRAEHIERALYYCPDCKSFNTLRSEKNHVFCTKCGMTAEYAEDLKLKAEKGTILGETVKEWYDKQWEILKGVELDGQTTLFSDKVEARLIVGRKREKLRPATMWADGVGIKVKTKAEEYSLDFSKKITTTILGKRKINFYLSDDTVLQVKGDERFNSIKYLHLNEIAKEKF
jgi:ribosomal protein L37AE/L43A